MPGDKLQSITARVELTVVITAKGTWSPDTTAEQIFRQAEKDVMDQIGQLISERRNWVFRGPLKVSVVVATEEHGKV